MSEGGNLEEYDDYDYDDSQDPYKHYFKFDPDAWDAWGKWLYKALDDITQISPNVWQVYGFPSKKFPVNSWNPNTGETKNNQYLGSNYQNQPIWKKKYFVSDAIQQQYKNHVVSHSKHFVYQPHYYKGMFDILN